MKKIAVYLPSPMVDLFVKEAKSLDIKLSEVIRRRLSRSPKPQSLTADSPPAQRSPSSQSSPLVTDAA